ncbi:Fic family protein [Leptospira idonii]|uniref:Fic family protein n=1 Tax=Leptospira idonii TaxID=1193500 RepID=A0A4R9LYY3_9LEPT|nr:Fic family protein [Leptospira idonii]TGN18036.1 Fic family protein [Leptospira idonii]
MLTDVLAIISELKTKVDTMRPIPTETMEKIMQKFRLDWNYHSNAIEGNSLSFGETKTFLLHGNTASGKPLKDHLDIKGHNEAILELEEIVKKEVELTEHRIRQFHQLILGEPYTAKAITTDGRETTKQIVPGKYKSQPNHVKTATEEIFYFTEPHLVPIEMENLLKWLKKNQNNEEMPKLVLAATFHYKFIRIHPFDDGNGRIARILMNLIFMMNGYPPVIVKTDDKENYFRVLRQADGGELEPFIEYIGNLLIYSLEMIVRGVEGQSIEEEDDLDKRLKLLLGKIDNERKDIIKQKKDAGNVFEAVTNSVGPLWMKLQQISPQMKNFFLDVTEEISTPLGNSSQTTYSNFSLLEDSYKEFAAEKKATFPQRIIFSMNLNGFKHKVKEGNFGIYTYIYVDFRDYDYTIHTSNSTTRRIVMPYGQKVSADDINEFVKRILEDWIIELEKQLET